MVCWRCCTASTDLAWRRRAGLPIRVDNEVDNPADDFMATWRPLIFNFGDVPMSRAIQIDQVGGPEQMKLVEVPVGQPGKGQIRIRHHACGLNYIDVYQRLSLIHI